MKCLLCTQPFTPREDKQLFCRRDCSITWYAIERRVAVQFLRAEPDYEEIMQEATKPFNVKVA